MTHRFAMMIANCDRVNAGQEPWGFVWTVDPWHHVLFESDGMT